jgi:hypothetical protein
MAPALVLAACSGSVRGGDELASQSAELQAASCGDRLRGETTEETQLHTYACNSALRFDGSEKVYLVNADSSGSVVASVDNFDWYPWVAVMPYEPGGPDPAKCIAANYYAAEFTATAGESYYVVVDQDGTVPTLTYDIQLACDAPTTELNCSDGFDDDSDYATDCFDHDCDADPACQNGACEPQGFLMCGDTLLLDRTEGFGSTNQVENYACSNEPPAADSPERTYEFSPDHDGWVLITASNYDDYPMILIIEDDGSGCDPNRCLTYQWYSEMFWAEAGKTYYVVMDGVGGGSYEYMLSVVCDPPSEETTCDDQVDNDGDFAIDCDDPDCDGSDACTLAGSCSPVANLDCGSQLVHGDTASPVATDEITSYSCYPDYELSYPEMAYYLPPLHPKKDTDILVTLSAAREAAWRRTTTGWSSPRRAAKAITSWWRANSSTSPPSRTT